MLRVVVMMKTARRCHEKYMLVMESVVRRKEEWRSQVPWTMVKRTREKVRMVVVWTIFNTDTTRQLTMMLKRQLS